MENKQLLVVPPENVWNPWSPMIWSYWTAATMIKLLYLDAKLQEKLEEANGVGWSPDDSAIVVWDSLLEYEVLIYSPDGRCLSKYQAYESGLGVENVAWSPCGQFLAVGSYYQILWALNHLTWKNIAEFIRVSTIRSPCVADGNSRVKYKLMDIPINLSSSLMACKE
ncbi:hypothetical protein J5N97_016991 [Dioscorea zingiberensis]|uniref:Uncharacterized protein n=1 Tax=Dioscorea zingiberensis TaxID=325984 RepID=A0A9D5CKK1_9LILI|nr:hypothetical protein J5N97_016991 [Dioscorea zingiberensis]